MLYEGQTGALTVKALLDDSDRFINGVSAVMYDRSGSRAHLGVSLSW